ncbi:hypothetical protein FOA52_012251 [Chlamydomonas sp. UWO 241]|nr:hypothetical protein FOA52_012251 [Chlamydomonas sp. UWO 241]
MMMVEGMKHRTAQLSFALAQAQSLVAGMRSDMVQQSTELARLNSLLATAARQLEGSRLCSAGHEHASRNRLLALKKAEGERAALRVRLERARRCPKALDAPSDPSLERTVERIVRDETVARLLMQREELRRELGEMQARLDAATAYGGMRAPAARVAVRKPVIARAASDEGFDSDKLLKDLQDKYEAIENKPQFFATVGAGLVGVWFSAILLGAVDRVPMIPKAFELVGLTYSGWFTYRYLLFKSSREELVQDVKALKDKISGSGSA